MAPHAVEAQWTPRQSHRQRQATGQERGKERLADVECCFRLIRLDTGINADDTTRHDPTRQSASVWFVSGVDRKREREQSHTNQAHGPVSTPERQIPLNGDNDGHTTVHGYKKNKG